MTPFITAPRTDFTNLLHIETQPARWLWPGRIPLGHITLIAGDPGAGKSTIAADHGDSVTGRRWRRKHAVFVGFGEI